MTKRRKHVTNGGFSMQCMILSTLILGLCLVLHRVDTMDASRHAAASETLVGVVSTRMQKRLRDAGKARNPLTRNLMLRMQTVKEPPNAVP